MSLPRFVHFWLQGLAPISKLEDDAGIFRRAPDRCSIFWFGSESLNSQRFSKCSSGLS